VRPSTSLVIAVLLVAGVAGCGRSSETTTILGGDIEKTSFRDVRQGIDELYRDHPEIRSFVARDVRYTPATRDKVMQVCSDGAPQTNPRERESSRILGCAPLIFFFYRYGRDSGVPQAVELARQLYWYAAAIKRPYDAEPVLSTLL
jgi:hypothetical protein